MEIYLMVPDADLTSVLPSEKKDLTDLQWAARSNSDWPIDRSVNLKILGYQLKDSDIYSDNAYFGSSFPLCLILFASKFFEKSLLGAGYFVGTNIENISKSEECFYKLFFFTSTLDVLNLEKSEFETFSDGRIMSVYRHFILEDALAGQSIFKMKHALGGETFVTGDMKTQIEQAGLVGFLFDKIWSTEEGPFDIRLSSPYVNVSDKRKARRLVSIKRQQAKKILTARSSMW